MPNRKNWTQKEDRVLKILKETRGLKKWSEIARKMAEQFGITSRTGKQCRERYHNHLDSSIVVNQWSKQEEQVLFCVHGEVGNKWSLIAQKLPGRSDNCVKNHFYSKLRKAMRKLNRIIQDAPSTRWRDIKLSLLTKIIETTEERFKNNSKFEEEIIDKCSEIVKGLFRLEEPTVGEREWAGEREWVGTRELIEEIMWMECRLRKNHKCLKQQKQQAETTQDSREIQKGNRGGGQHHPEEEPFYEIFRRVCQSIFLNNN